MEVLISRRTVRILEFLLETQEYTGIAQLASNLQLTPAQVRHSLDELEAWLGQTGSTLVRRQRKGIRLRATESARKVLLGNLQKTRRRLIWLTPHERRQLLLLQLLISTQPIKQDEISTWLGISRSSLFRDLSFARTWLKQRHLGLITRRSGGLAVEAPEREWRAVLVDLLLACLDQETIVSACAASGQGFDPSRLPHAGLLRDPSDFLDNLALNDADRCVAVAERKLSLRLNDDARVWLIISLSLVIYRAFSAARSAFDERAFDLDIPAEIAEAALEARHTIEALLHHEMDTSEYYFISECLMKVTGPDTEGSSVVACSAQCTASSERTATLLAGEAGKYLHAGLLRDQDLIECLSLELAQGGSETVKVDSSSGRKSTGDPEEADPLLTFASRAFGPILLKNGWQPSAVLLRALVVHLSTALDRLRRKSVFRKVWVVCGSGVATTRNLVSRLNMHLPGLQILGVASAFEILHNPRLILDADAIISTIRLDLDGIPVIHVSALLTSDDISKVVNALGLDHRQQQNHPVKIPSRCKISLPEVLSPDMIEVVPGASSWEAVVNLAGELLLRSGAIWPSYIEAMKDMISLYGPYMVVAPGVALLHAGAEMGAKRLAVSVVRLKKPVCFGHETFDPIHIALALSSVDHYSHIQIISDIMDLMGNAQKRRNILKAASPEKILANITYQLGPETTKLPARAADLHD